MTNSTKWRLYDTHRYPIQAKSQHAQLDVKVLHETEDLLRRMMLHPEAIAFLNGEHSALCAFEQKSEFRNDDFSLLSKVMVHCHQEKVQFARLDLIQVYPERRARLQKEALLAAIDFHLISSFFNPRDIQLARKSGVLPQRNFTISP